MTIQELGSIGEFVAAIATLGTLVYLAAQIRQNTQAVRGSTIHAMTDSMQAELQWSHEIAAIWTKSFEHPEQLTSTEAWSLSSWLTSALMARQNEFFQYRRGLLDSELWEASEGIIRINLSTPWTRDWWEVSGRGGCASAFVAHVDGLLDQAPPFRLDEFLDDLRSRHAGNHKA